MPFRAFGDSDYEVWDSVGVVFRGFQCPFGHSGILTRLQPNTHSQTVAFQCPFGHSGILTWYRSCQARSHWASFNALSGIRGF